MRSARLASIRALTLPARSNVAAAAFALNALLNSPPEWHASTITTTFTPVRNFARSAASS